MNTKKCLRLFLLLVGLTTFMTGCDNSETIEINDNNIIGFWKHIDYDDRECLDIKSDGTFTTYSAEDEAPTQWYTEESGTWSLQKDELTFTFVVPYSYQQKVQITKLTTDELKIKWVEIDDGRNEKERESFVRGKIGDINIVR